MVCKVTALYLSRVTSRCSVTSSKDGLQSYSPVSFKGNLALLGDFFEGWFAKLQPCIFNHYPERRHHPSTCPREYHKAESPVKLYFHTPLNKRLFPRESPRKDGVFLGLRPPLITEKQPPCWVVNVLNVGLKRIVPFPMFCNVQN